jgi:hypothetical protein
MTCDGAREALLEVDLPIVDGDQPDLAHHLAGCVDCAKIAAALSHDAAALAAVLRRRAGRRRRMAVIAAASTAAAAAVIFAVARPDRRVVKPPAAVNSASTAVVSVEVPRGKSAMVLQTKDPNVTIVWLTDEPRGGS